MISKRVLTLLSQRVAVISFLLLNFWLIPPSARGQTLYWDVPGGTPSGVWDLVSSSWSLNPAGGTQIPWTNTSNAVFSRTKLWAPGKFTVTLAANVIVGDLTYRGGNLGSTLQIAAVGGNAITTANAEMNVTVGPLT